MITLRYYLDARRPSRRPDGRFPLKLAVTKRGDTALMPVLAWATKAEWDPVRQHLRGRFGYAGQVNEYLTKMMLKFEDAVREIALSGEAARMPATAVRDYLARKTLESGPGVTIRAYMTKVAEGKAWKTGRLFFDAIRAMERFDPGMTDRAFDQLAPEKVQAFDKWMQSKYSMNTRNSYLGKLAQVARKAHEEGVIPSNPCRSLAFEYVTTKSRALTLEQLRSLLAYETKRETDADFLDFFRFTFYSRAANAADIVTWTPEDIFNGRLIYKRRKTGKQYDVRVEPELAEIIERRGDGDHLFTRIATRAKYQDYTRDCNAFLGRAAKELGLPAVTLYWARHTFASLLLEIGTPVELIAAALGHSYGPRVTMGYVNIRRKQVDDAVRRLYDYVAGTWLPKEIL